ncbi:unnamed protein product [Caenorhabditis angaria]|uniref:DUF676 domain-containing protein n=1 Tax=Caenorhabditis angaria TaxID=860376 RepID=A0A9P1MSH1_9PELO|nr:unnamed protein product [Caenorhabditis angaria]
MRVDVMPVFNVNFKLCEFFNINLDERGYYQVRISPKYSSDFTTTIDFDEQKKAIQKPERSTLQNDVELLPSCVVKNVGVSKTFEITFVDERSELEEPFNLIVRLNSLDNVCTVKYLFVDVEIWYMDRYRPPLFEHFQKISHRSLRIPLDPTRLSAAARSLYFENSHIAAVTLRVFSSLVKIDAKTKKTSPENHQIRSQRAKNTHSAAIHALFYSKRSIERFIAKYIDLTEVRIAFPAGSSDIQKLKKVASEEMEQDSSPYKRIELDVMRFSSELDYVYSQLVDIFENNEALTIQLITIYDKQRRNIFREAFFCQERLKEEMKFNGIIDRSELFQVVTKSKYLKKMPSTSLFCSDFDSPGDLCPIIFEECFTKSPPPIKDLRKSEDTQAPVASTSEPSTSKFSTSSKKSKSFREKASKKLRFMKPRRRSLDHKSPTKLIRESPRSLTLTLDNLKEIKIPLMANGENTEAEGEERCSAAGEMQPTTSMVSQEETIAALLTSSPSADQIHTITEKVDDYQEEHPQDIMDIYEFIRERENVKKKLADLNYDGYLYSEKSILGQTAPTFTPMASVYIESLDENKSMNDILSKPVSLHLVVFVHGLEGSPDDLMSYKNCLRQIVESNYNSEHLHDENAEAWKFDYLLSKSNLRTTWNDFDVMSNNLLAEIEARFEECAVDYDRISFIAHSLGGLIVRNMIGKEAEMEEETRKKLIPKLHTLMTLNSPHLGLAYMGKHVHWGVNFVQLFKKSTSVYQMSFRDKSKIEETFIYELSKNGAFSKFVNVLLVGNPHDKIVPCNSSLLLPIKESLKDSSNFGVHYKKIIENVINSIKNGERVENFVRYTTIHQVVSASTNRIIRRAAHVGAVEDLIFIEKLFSISAVKYFL